MEHANDDERTYYIIEKEPLVNTFISVPKDKGSLNCASFVAGIVEAVLDGCNFPAKVTAHWHKGTTFMVTPYCRLRCFLFRDFYQPLYYFQVKFEEAVIARDKTLE